MDDKLTFSAPQDGTGRLVFGDTGGGVVVPDAAFGIDADLPGLGGITLRAGAALTLDADLPGLDGAVGFVWDANVSRGLRADLDTHWQQADPLARGLAAHWQQAAPLQCAAAARWQQAAPSRAGLDTHWQQAERLRAAMASHWQQGEQLRSGLYAHWQEAIRLRAATVAHWQQGEQRRAGLVVHWQETLRLRAAVRGHWQQGALLRAAATNTWGQGVPVHIGLRAHWQEAMRPHSGVSKGPMPPEPKPPCYDPATVGRLVFSDLWANGARLVFICQRPGQVLPPAGIIVLPRRSCIVINSIEVRRADALAGDPLPSESFQMQLNRQSWTWSFSAGFHASARDALMPGAGGEPVELEVRVNGQPFRLQAERIGRSRRFPERMVTVQGRGKAALLDAPHAPVQTFTHALARTAHQLMTEALTVNGVAFGWAVDWQLTDWLVPAGVWMHQGTWASALADIAGAAGGYLQPHDTDALLHVLPLWPTPWWEWDTLAPDIELPAGISEIDETEVVDLPAYNRIFVSGEAGGHAADLTRSGTPGDVLKQPMALHPLITTMGAAKQRAIAELSESGRMLKHKMTLPVLPETGVIKPGTVLRYVDDVAALRLGIVRATSIAQQFPVLTQSLEIDSHA